MVSTCFRTFLGARQVNLDLTNRDPGVYYFVWPQRLLHGCRRFSAESPELPLATLRGQYCTADVLDMWKEYGVVGAKIACEAVGQDLLAKYNEIGSVKGTIGSGSSQKLNLGRAEGAPFSSFAMTVKQLPKAAEIFRDLMIEEHRWPSSIKAEDLVPTHDAICMGADKLFTGNLGCK